MAINELEWNFDLPPQVIFEEYCYSLIGDRRDADGNIPFSEVPNPDTHLFPVEVSQRDKLLDLWASYMTTEGLTMVRNSYALANLAHQGQYRDSKEPYTTHTYEVALMLSEGEVRQDPVTVSSALLHDTVEDELIPLDIIGKFISPEVAETVSDLTKLKGKRQRKEIAQEENRLKIIDSLIDNVRVAIIKIHDRLHNMRTLRFKKGRGTRLGIIQETEETWIPLAKRLGLFKKADELDELCLRERGKEYDELADQILRKRQDFFRLVAPHHVVDELSQLADIDKAALHTRIPGVSDVYRGMGELRDVRDDDFYINVDIELLGYSQYQDPLKWGEAAMQLANKLSWLKEYELVESIDEINFRREVAEDLVDSLFIYLRRIRDGLRARVNIFPQDAYAREQVSLTDMNYQRTPIGTDRVYEVLMWQDEVAIRHFWALEKHAVLTSRFKRILDRYQKGELFSAQLLGQLEPRLPVGFIRVIGVDDQGREQPWSIKRGSTVMDYIKDISPTNWPTTLTAQVNGGTEVPLNHILQAGEKVHIAFDLDNVKHWDPLWIHCFKNDEEGKKTVRRRIKRLLSSDEVVKQSELLSRVYQVSKWRITQDLAGGRVPLRIGLGRAMEYIRQHDPDITEEDFFVKVGLGEVDDDIISGVADILREPNKSVGAFRVGFRLDLPGQAVEALRSVLGRQESINLIDLGAETYGEGGPSVVIFYIDPDDHSQAQRIVDKIASSMRLQELKLDTVSYRDPKQDIFHKVFAS